MSLDRCSVISTSNLTEESFVTADTFWDGKSPNIWNVYVFTSVVMKAYVDCHIAVGMLPISKMFLFLTFVHVFSLHVCSF